MIVDDISITLDASTMKVQVIDKPLIHIDHDEVDEDLRGFFAKEVALIEEDLAPFIFDCFTNIAVNYIMCRKGHFPGTSLGSKKSRVPHPVTDSKSVENLFGLGYKPTWKELKKHIAQQMVYRNPKDKDNIPFPPYQPTLNGQFIREG